MKKYPKYKESGVEWISYIPEGWKMKKAQYFGTIEHGQSYTPSDVIPEGGVLVLRACNIQNGKLALDDCVFIKEDKASTSKLVSEGDIIICSTNGSLALVGKSMIIDKPINASFGSFMMRFRTNEHKGFINYQLSSIVDFFRGTFKTSTINQLTIDRLSKMPFCIPSLPEQHKISEFLDYKTGKIDDLVSKLSERIEDLKKYRQSVISETVTRGLDKNAKLKDSGIEWIGMIPEHWEATRFKFMAEVKSNLVHPEDYSLYPQVSPDSIEKDTGHLLRWKTVEESGVISDNHLFHKGQIVYSKIRPNLNKVIIAPFDGLCSADMYPIETRQHTKFLFWQMLSGGFASQVNSVIMSRVKMPKINAEELGEIIVALPPLSEQQAIADYLDRKTKQIDEAIAATEQRIADLQSYRSSLITEAVTGQIDVRDWSAPAQ